MRSSTSLTGLAVAGLLSGCSVLSPVPLMELAKAGGAAAASAISTGPSHASHTVWHEHPTVAAVCVDYNPAAPDPDFAPALQAELREHQIDSRIYEGGATPASCHWRLSYTADVDWGTPPLSAGWVAYLRDATLTLRDANGQVVASSAYKLDGPFQMGKWASSRSKLAPVVTALVTGFEN